MKELHGTASAVVSAPPEKCIAMLAAIEAYPNWYPDGVREVETLERDGGGQPTKVRTTLHVEVTAFSRDFDLTMSVAVESHSRVALKKLKADSSDPPFDVIWRVSERDGTDDRARARHRAPGTSLRADRRGRRLDRAVVRLGCERGAGQERHLTDPRVSPAHHAIHGEVAGLALRGAAPVDPSCPADAEPPSQSSGSGGDRADGVMRCWELLATLAQIIGVLERISEIAKCPD